MRDSVHVHCEQTSKKQNNTGVFETSVHPRVLFSISVGMETVKALYCFSFPVIAQGARRHHTGRIYSTNIDYTNYA